MELCTNSQSRVLALGKTKTTQALEITSLKRRIKKLEKKQRSRTHKLKKLYKVGLTARVDSSKDDQILGEDASKQGRKIHDIDVDEDITLVNDQDDAKMFDVNNLHGEEVFVEKKVADEVNAGSIAITGSDKGKAIMIEEPVKPKKKDQVRLDEEVALKLQAEFDEEEQRLARERKKLKDLKNKSFDYIQMMFDRAFNRVNTFVDFRTELVEGSSKRAREKLTQENAKTQKVDDDKETTELKELMKIIPDEEEVAIDVIPLMYLGFNQMLKEFNKEDLEDLYNLVKAKYGSTRPVEDLDLLLGGCKVMRTLASVEIEIMLILGLPCCLSSSSVMSTPVFVDPEISTQADGAHSSRVPVQLSEDPYEAIRQAYLVGTDTESESFEDLVETETLESPHVVAPPTCHIEESEGSGTSGARSTSSDSTAPLLPDHPLTHTTPALVHILCRTTHMAMRVPPVMSPGLSAGIVEVAAMSDSAFRKRIKSFYDSLPSPTILVRKRYRGTSELILDTNSEEDDEVEGSSDSDSESKDSEDEGPTAEDEDHVAGDEGLAARDEGCGSSGVGTAISAPLGLGYGALRCRELTLEEDHVYSTFEVRQGHGSALEPERSKRVSASRQHILATWTDLEDEPSIVPSPILSPMISLTVPSPVALLVATSTATIPVDDDRFIETALKRELQEMRGRVIALEQERDRKEW
uniref:Uncharacterized protein n=1 Tax=Tanacetum cinerariifolium TaxID=118510 RepID=A0A6L2NDC5_TANCI|nr:hypothetical protein [Tanacetum cinerariifolium]